MFSIKTQVRMKKAQWKAFSFQEFMTKRRYVGKYPKFKNFVLINFLFVVVSFIGWNVSVNLPQVSFKWSSDPIVYENHAQAKFESIQEVPVDVKITDCNSAVDVMAPKYGASKDLLKKIVKAESGNDEKAANGTSSARGCFQFIIGTWEDYGRKLWGDDFYEKNRYNPKDNVELAAWMIGDLGELSHWDASKHNWK